MARSWAAGDGPGDSPLTIDLDSTICETYGLAKEGARHHGYTGARGYHPLSAIAAGTGEVLMSRLREGRVVRAVIGVQGRDGVGELLCHELVPAAPAVVVLPGRAGRGAYLLVKLGFSSHCFFSECVHRCRSLGR